MKIKLIALDVDGTLVNSAKKLTAPVKEAIQKAKDCQIKIVICTGRPLSGVRQLLKELKLNQADDQFVICFGGGVVETTNGKVLSQQGLTYADFIDLEALARKLRLHFQALTNDRIYTCNKDIGDYTLYEANLVSLGISYRTPEEMRGLPLIKGMYIDPAPVLDKAIADRTPFKQLSDHLVFMKTAPFYFEAYPKGVNKGNALKKLCQRLHINADQVMAVGDEENDLSMLKFAGLGIAMGNAVPQVKKISTAQTLDNDHDGVAWAIKKYAL